MKCTGSTGTRIIVAVLLVLVALAAPAQAEEPKTGAQQIVALLQEVDTHRKTLLTAFDEGGQSAAQSICKRDEAAIRTTVASALSVLDPLPRNETTTLLRSIFTNFHQATRFCSMGVWDEWKKSMVEVQRAQASLDLMAAK